MECQVDKSEHFQHLLLFAFNQGNKAAQAVCNICAVYGQDAMNERTARRWLLRFKDGNFNLKDMERSRRPVEFNENRLNQLIHEDPRQTTVELAAIDCNPSALLDIPFRRPVIK